MFHAKRSEIHQVYSVCLHEMFHANRSEIHQVYSVFATPAPAVFERGCKHAQCAMMIIMMPHVDLTCAEHMHHSFKDIAVEVAGPGDGGHSCHSEDDLLDMARKREETDTKRPKRGLAAKGPLATLGSQAVGLEDAILIDENNEIKQQDATESIEAPSFSESDSEGSSSSSGSESSHGTAKEVTECNDAAPSTCSPVVIAYDPRSSAEIHQWFTLPKRVLSSLK